MKVISSALQAAITAGDVCLLYSIIATDGTAVHLTDHDVPITFGGNTYQPSAGLQKFALKLTNNTSVSNQNVAANVIDLPQDELLSGKWDSAVIEIDIYGWRMTTPEILIFFRGAIGVIGWTDTAFQADIANLLRALNKAIGKMVTPTCRHRLYDLGTAFDEIGNCGVDPTSFTVTATVTAILTQRYKFKVALTGKPDGWATNGYVQWTSGSNNGVTNIVKIHAVDSTAAIGESVEFLLPAGTDIQVGDTLKLLAGCDHTLATCKSKFNNVLNFGGFPHLQVDVNDQITPVA